jgi:tRNA-specific 2-thiouridylase
MKFGLLWETAEELGCEAMATGHYVKVERRESGRWGLRRGDERRREQSYYLHRLNQDQISRFRAPLGTWQKSDLRVYARQRGLPVATKEGSQEICFISNDDYRAFLREHPLGRKTLIEPGDIVDREGRVLGRHSGIINYTIGQRRGLGIAHPHPLYVIEIDPENNRVVVGEKKDVLGRELIASHINWVSIPPPDETISARVQIRYRSKAEPATVAPAGEGRVRVVFDEPQPAITPGQAAVFYDTNNVWLLGGGWIEDKSAAS